MQIKRYNVVKIECDDMFVDSYFVFNPSESAAVLFSDGRYRCSIYDCTLNELKDVAVFWGWNPDRPNTYLARKYNIRDYDIFGGVMRMQEWFEVLFELGVLSEDVVVDFNDDLETAFREMFE